MYYFPKLKVFKSERCEFDPHNMIAHSYGWWQFVACIRGEVVFNNARYSMQTGKQQAIIRDLLNKLGVKYRTVSIKSGLTRSQLQREIGTTRYNIGQLENAIANPRSRAKTNEWRGRQIGSLERHIITVRKLMRASRSKAYKGKLNFSAIPKRPKYARRTPLERANDQTMRTLGIKPRKWVVNQELCVVNGPKFFTGKSRAGLTLINGGKS